MKVIRYKSCHSKNFYILLEMYIFFVSEYYIYQINEMDTFIGELIEMLSVLDEPTVLVLFGDHLPGLQIKNEDLVTNTTYATPYVIWNNFGLEERDVDLTSYQLASQVLDAINIDNNYLTDFHSNREDSETYSDNLKLLQYDILYGNNYANIFPNIESTNLQLGIDDIIITGFKEEEHKKIVVGENFTRHSAVFINSEKCDTYIIDNNQLEFVTDNLQSGSLIEVKQLGRNNLVLSSTEAVVFEGFN